MVLSCACKSPAEGEELPWLGEPSNNSFFLGRSAEACPRPCCLWEQRGSAQQFALYGFAAPQRAAEIRLALGSSRITRGQAGLLLHQLDKEACRVRNGQQTSCCQQVFGLQSPQVARGGAGHLETTWDPCKMERIEGISSTDFQHQGSGI